jgi:hypothetical protein
MLVFLRHTLGRIHMVAAALALAGCAHEVAFHGDYLPDAQPAYVAQGKLLMVMPEEQRVFVYEGAPSSRTGDFTKLIVPIGTIVEEIARDVFGECFAYGVEVADSRAGRDDFVIALEGDMQEFIYSYTEVIDAGFNDETVDTWIVPEVEIAFAVKAFDRDGRMVLDKVYDSGVAAGEGYMVTSKPAERINRVLHTTLHDLMIELAADVRPFLMESCEVTEVATTWP